ncbi:DUF6942 family protein [Shewanella sp. SR44-3]|uniref:DUF6942 family protein n=1 Tax=Shewanella sp. SR44-3 TaxID=2760936 RepID=UPI00217573C7|nr:hypothetical protein [Shewanella sp. SR44-3]
MPLTTAFEFTAFMTDAPQLDSLYFESQSGQIEVAFYLPNPPILPNGVSSSWQVNTETAIDELIAINGNHWRKIFTIMAKLCQSQCTSTKTWQGLRKALFVAAPADNPSTNVPSTNVLSRRLHFLSGAHEPWDDVATIKPRYQLDPEAKWHIVCGLEAQTKLGIIDIGSRTLDKQGKVRLLSINDKLMQGHNRVLLTPYLDYRQFPNLLIEQVHTLLHSCDE